MTGKSHDAVAFLALLIVLLNQPILPIVTLPTMVAAFSMNFVGGLFPDIDQPTSDLWDNFRLGPFIARVVCPALGGHRHISHSLLGFGLIGWLSNLIFGWLASIILVDMHLVWWAFMIGVGSHIVADLPTKAGVPLLWPLKIKFGIPPFKWLRFESGSWVENWLVFPGVIGAILYLIYQNYPLWLSWLKMSW